MRELPPKTRDDSHEPLGSRCLSFVDEVHAPLAKFTRRRELPVHGHTRNDLALPTRDDRELAAGNAKAFAYQKADDERDQLPGSVPRYADVIDVPGASDTQPPGSFLDGAIDTIEGEVRDDGACRASLRKKRTGRICLVVTRQQSCPRPSDLPTRVKLAAKDLFHHVLVDRRKEVRDVELHEDLLALMHRCVRSRRAPLDAAVEIRRQVHSFCDPVFQIPLDTHQLVIGPVDSAWRAPAIARDQPTRPVERLLAGDDPIQFRWVQAESDREGTFRLRPVDRATSR